MGKADELLCRSNIPSEKKKVEKALLRQIFIKDQYTMKWNIVLHFKCFETAFVSDVQKVF